MMRTHYAPQAELDRWNAYQDPTTFDPTTRGPILANLVGAGTWEELRVREDAFVAVRAMTLHTHDIPGSFDLDGLRAVHHHLFQDVYAWAGDLRTVTTGKSEPFAKPDEIEAAMALVADRIEQTRQLRGLSEVAVCTELARVHHETNLAHPFRLGNGRTQREFVTALASVSDHMIDWQTITGEAEANALGRARRGDLAPLTALYASALGRVTPEGRPSANHGFFSGRSAGVWR